MANAHAMFQHPILAINSGVQNFSLKTRPITLKLNPGEFENIKKSIENAVEKFEKFTSATIKQFNLESDQDILKYQAQGKRDIFLSALSEDFLTKYSSEINYEDTYGKLSAFVADVVGSQSATAKKKAAEEKLASMTRDTSTNEKFSRFLTRLERIAKVASNDTNVQKYLIDLHFDRALSPKLRNFLREQRQNNESSQKVAEFLDSMDKYKQTAEVCSLEELGTRNEIHALNEKFDLLQAKMLEILQSQREERFDYNAIDIDAISHLKQNPNSRRQPNTKKAVQSFRRPWELDQNGRPFYCQKCGLRGHRTEQCKGTKMICHHCHKPGHIKPVCPERKTTQTKN